MPFSCGKPRGLFGARTSEVVRIAAALERETFVRADLQRA